MNSRTTAKFWRLFNRLPAEVQQEAKQAYRTFRTDPSHPGLQFKKLRNEDDIYSARIGLDYRVLCARNRDRVVWFWIGTHAEYDKLV